MYIDLQVLGPAHRCLKFQLVGMNNHPLRPIWKKNKATKMRSSLKIARLDCTEAFVGFNMIDLASSCMSLSPFFG